MARGKCGVGLEDNHRRKFSCGAISSKRSMIFCKSESHESMRWQLARNTQLPSTVAVAMSLVATGACPCPSATEKNRSPRPFAAASCRRFAVGSTPGDKTKMSGASVEESLYVSFRSSTGGSTYLRPNELATYAVAAISTRSMRKQRTKIMRWSSLHLLSHSPGSSDLSGDSGVALRYHSSQAPALPSKDCTTPLKCGTFSSSTTLSHASSEIHAGAGLAG
mmetsp:Transcript_4038/g.6307  ORF Transcript_4038/g.6307 Transcript_4038/m.6307 type:complete len:221 (+) Transcript_4038:1675-2337(+)